MSRTIKAMEEKYRQPSLDMVRRTFTNSETAEDALDHISGVVDYSEYKSLK